VDTIATRRLGVRFGGSNVVPAGLPTNTTRMISAPTSARSGDLVILPGVTLKVDVLTSTRIECPDDAIDEQDNTMGGVVSVQLDD
jgi:hypothetical protein